MFFTVFPFFYAKRSNSSLWSSIFLKIDMIDLWKRLTESRSNRSILWSQKNEWCHRKTDDWIPNPGLTSSLSRTVLSLTYISLRAPFFRSCPIAQTVFPWGVVKWKGGGGDEEREGGREGRNFKSPVGSHFFIYWRGWYIAAVLVFPVFRQVCTAVLLANLTDDANAKLYRWQHFWPSPCSNWMLI